MEKNVKLSILLQIYGKLLTENQFNILDDYYNNDLSLSEIAENNSITRQAVRDILKKGENKLFEYEEKLELMKKNESLEKSISNIILDISKINDKSTKEEITDILQIVKNKLNSLT